MFFIDKTGDEVTEVEQQRLDQRALRFADGNRSYKKKLSVAELVAAAVSLFVVCTFLCVWRLSHSDGRLAGGGRLELGGVCHRRNIAGTRKALPQTDLCP